jgi:hypothetical protein
MRCFPFSRWGNTRKCLHFDSLAIVNLSLTINHSLHRSFKMPLADHTATLRWVTPPGLPPLQTQQTNSHGSRSKRRPKVRTNVTYNIQGCHVHWDTIGSYDTFKTMKQLSEATKGHFGTDVGLRLDRKAGTDRSYDSANVADINGKIYHGHHYKTSGGERSDVFLDDISGC